MLVPGALRPMAAIPCGLGGGESALCVADMAQVAGCAASLTAQKKPVIWCKIFGGTRFQMAAASKCTDSHPCTNRPLQCIIRPSKPAPVVHRKLNMRRHLDRAHSDATRDPAFMAFLETSATKQGLIEKHGAKRPRQSAELVYGAGSVATS